ncbi:MAG: choice-of-anchor J domain-containing protein [Chitinophagaceae bacterium]|nr:choice-of-anchor J domain-containing protein [Rubrivivax sp.]
MKWVQVTAGVLAAGLMVGSHAQTVLSEGFDDVAALTASGWVFTNASTSAGLTWFQGNSGIYGAQFGAADSYAAANFNSTTALSGVVDNWLISPELAVGAGSTLSFFTRASDAGFFDLLEVRFSSGASAAAADFSTLVGTVGSAAGATYPAAAWVAVSFTLPTAASGRFALRYSVPNALDASYIGVDSLTVTAVPEPAAWALFGLGLAAVGSVAVRRSRTC